MEFAKESAGLNKRRGSYEESKEFHLAVVMSLSSWLVEYVTFLQSAWYRCLWETGAVRVLGVSSPRTSPGAALLNTSGLPPQLIMG